MNSFTSSSDRCRHVLGAFLLAFLFGLAVPSAALKSYVMLTTGPERFVQEIGSKAKHMRLTMPSSGYDAVFVGNSRTEYGIDSSVFAAMGLRVYNFGVAGAELANYPSMVETAARLKLDFVFIGIRPEEFFRRDISINADLSWHDVMALWGAPYSLQDKLRGFYGWLSGLNAVRQYADQIYARLSEAYRKFSASDDAVIPASGVKTDIMEADCRVIGRTVLAGGLISYKCASGDFIMQGHISSSDKVVDTPVIGAENDIVTAKIEFLESVARQTRERHGARLVIILEPAPKADPLSSAAADALRARDIHVVDMTGLETDAGHWGDGVHLNLSGRRLYSQRLAAAIRPLLLGP